MVMKKWGKSGQISNFMIIGLILILSVALFLVLKYNILGNIGITDNVNEEVVPIKAYVESCAKSSLKDAIVLLGSQGGYVKFRPEIDQDPYSYIKLDDYGLFKTPYWYYNGYDRIPSLYYMESQISDYVKFGTVKCVDNFALFDKQYDITQGSMDVQTQIGDGRVTVMLDYPLVVKSKGLDTVNKISKFTTSVDVKLKKMYELSHAIADSESSGMFLENTTMDLMAIDPDVPLTDLMFKCGRMIWQKTDVADEIKTVMSLNLPRVRIDNTNYIKFRTSDEERLFEEYERNHFLWGVTDKDYSDLRAGLSYDPSWSFNMGVRPSEFKTMKSNSAQGAWLLSFMCLNIYHFTYDIDYPVLVKIKDEQAFNNDGFVFQFALPVTIRNNEGQKQEYGSSNFRTFSINQEFCDEKGSRIQTIRAYDERDGTDIEGVNISFRCVSNICTLGKTELNDQYYQLKTNIPTLCHGGRIIAEAPGYLDAEVPYENADTTTITMKPLKTLGFNVRLIDNDNPKIDVPITKDMKIAIAIENANASHQFYVAYPYDGDITDIEVLNQESNYKITAVAFDEGTIIGMYSHNWTYGYYDLLDARNITFVVPVSKKPATKAEEALLLQKTMDYKYTSESDPRLI